MTRLCCAALLVVSSGFLSRAADKADTPDDPLPEGAKFRLGTGRLRNPSGVTNDSTLFSALTPDGKFLLGLSLRQGTVFIDPATGQTVRVLGRDPNAKANEAIAQVVAVSADGSRAAAAAHRSAVMVLDTQTGAVLVRVPREAAAGPDGLALSADGKRLAFGSERQGFGKDAPAVVLSAVVWDVDANKQLTSVVTPYTTKAFVALSPDGKRLAAWGTGSLTRPGGGWGKGVVEPGGGFGKGLPAPVADPSNGVQIWDAETGKEVAKVSAGTVPITTVAFAPDGASVAVSGGTGSVHLFDLATKEEKRAFFGCSGQGQRLAFSPDGKTLAAVSDEEVVQRWSVADGRLIDSTEPPVPPGPRTTLSSVLRAGKPDVRGFVYPDNGRVRVWGVRGDLNLVWDAPAGRAISPTDGHRAPVGGAAADKEFLTVADDGVLIRWDTGTGKQLGTSALKVAPEKLGFGSDRIALFEVVLAPNGAWAVTCGISASTQVFALPSGRQHFVLPGRHEKRALAFSRDGGKVVVVAGGGEKTGLASKVSVFDLAGARRVGEFELPSGETAATACLSPDGTRVCTFGTRRNAGQNDEYAVTGWELATGKKLGAVAVPMEKAFGITVSVAALTDTTALVVAPGGAFVADFAAGKKVRALDLGDRAPLPLIPPAVSPDGKTVAIYESAPAAGERAPAIVLFDAETGKAKKTFAGPLGLAWGIAFSTDGKYLLAGSRDSSTLVYDLSAP